MEEYNEFSALSNPETDEWLCSVCKSALFTDEEHETNLCQACLNRFRQDFREADQSKKDWK